MFVIYNILIFALFLILLPFALLFLLLKPKLCGEAKARIGIYPKKVNNYIKNLKKEKKELIWVHAASVGELMIARTIIEELVKEHSNIGYIVSTNSSSGMKMAEQLFGAEKSFLIPVDLPWTTKSLVKKVRPKVTILVEFEAWPNLIDQLFKVGSKIILVNGAMNKKIFKTYNYFPGLLTTTLNKLDFLGMQSAEEVEKVKALGVKHSKIGLIGNLKLDSYYKKIDEKEKKELRNRLKIPQDTNVLIAGSTHAGEEEIIFRTYQDIKKEIRDLILIIAPRHIERTEEVKQLGENYNLKIVRRTQIDEIDFHQATDETVIILDTIGELANFYSMATIVFVGGSLVNIGCHNILEPIIYGKPVIFGPYIQNVKESAELLLKNQIGIMIKNENELKANLLSLLQDKERQQVINKKSIGFLQKEEGAFRKSINIVEEFLTQTFKN